MHKRSRSILALGLCAGLAFACAPAHAMRIDRVVSPNGIEAWLVEDHSVPLIDLEVSFKDGAVQDPDGKLGLATLVTGLLDEGAGPYDSQAFQGKLADQSSELTFSASLDGVRGHLKALTRNRDEAFELFHLALTHPRFDKEPVERVRAQILSEIAQTRSHPQALASHEWMRLHFPNHPYGRPALGTEATIKVLTAGDLKGWTAKHLVRDGTLIGVSGDITPEQLAPLLDRVFAALPATGQSRPVAEVEPALPGDLTVIERAIPQSVAVFGQKGVKRDDPDWYAALVMNYILGGGGFSSWLTDEVREKRGLAYSVYSQLNPLSHSGLILGGVATRNEKLAQSLDLIAEQWDRMRTQGPSAQELADAKTYLIGSFPLQLDSTNAVASLLVTLQRDHLGIDYLSKRDGLINQVTLDDIKRVADRLLDKTQLSTVVVGRPEGLPKK